MSKPERAGTEPTTLKSSNSADRGGSKKAPGKGERKIAVLMTVCLLGALGVVMYRKFEARRAAAATNGPFVAMNDKTDDPASSLATSDTTDTHATFASRVRQTAADEELSDSQPSWSTDAARQLADSADLPPLQDSEPGDSAWGEPVPHRRQPQPLAEFAQDPVPAEFSAAPQAAIADASGENWDPFATDQADPFAAQPAEPAPAPDTPHAEVAATPNPFSRPLRSDLPEESQPANRSSDASLAIESPPPQNPPLEVEVQTVQAGPSLGGNQETIDLFGSDPLPDPLPADQPATQRLPPRESPWDLADGTTAAPPRGTSEPLLIEPGEAQVITVTSDNPFGGAPTARNPEFQGPSVPPAETHAPEIEWPVAVQSDPVESHVPAKASAEFNDPFNAASGARISQAVSEEAVDVHVVRSGDSYWDISHHYYGSGRYFTALAAYNQLRIPDPKKIRPGMKVLIPEAAVLEQRFPRLVSGSYGPAPTPRSSEPAGFFVSSDGQPRYRVAKGDTLSDIALRHLGRASRWVQVYGLNRDQLKDANSLREGVVLRLPADASPASVLAAPPANR